MSHMFSGLLPSDPLCVMSWQFLVLAPWSCFVARFCKRSELPNHDIPQMAWTSEDIDSAWEAEDTLDDVVMLTKQYMSSQHIVQKPIIVLPGMLALQMAVIPVQTAPKLPLSEQVVLIMACCCDSYLDRPSGLMAE